jgi:proline iminopeptidase
VSRAARVVGAARTVTGLAGAAVLAIVVGAAATVTTALVTGSPWLFLGAGASAAAMTWTGSVRRYARAGGASRRWSLTGLAAVLSAVVLAGVLVPVSDPVVSPTRPPGAGTWTLPGGQTIAFGVERAAHPVAPPVVIVHGGPGVPDLAGDLRALKPLTADGHDVYAYAQPGTGDSSRLADPLGHTVRRQVQVLDQVRRHIGAARIDLVGHSYGAFLAAAYLAAHPDRVARVVFTSPGSLRDGLSGSALQAALTPAQRRQVYQLLARPRLLLAYTLLQADPGAAHAFAGDRELDARMDRVTDATTPALHCPGSGGHGPVLHGTGFYANQIPQSWHHPPVPDIRARLSAVHVPALVLKGQCDYVDWATAAAYVTALPDARLAYLPNAGHDLKTDQPAAYLDTIRAFLAGRPVPHLHTPASARPAGYQPHLGGRLLGGGGSGG